MTYGKNQRITMVHRSVKMMIDYLVLQRSDGQAQARQSTQGNVQESWSGNYLYSSLHPSYLGDSPES